VTADYSWSFDPGVILSIGVVGFVYVRRWRTVRAVDGARSASGWRLTSFIAGLAMVAISLISPVDALSQQLALMHMVSHILLLDGAPILCTLGLTKVILRPVTRRVQVIERHAGYLAHPAVAVLIYAGLLWVWHIPRLYDATLEHSGIHVFEHLCFTFAGALYWWHLLSPIRTRFHMTGIGPVLYMASTKITVGMLGILLAFTNTPLFHAYGNSRPWGLSPVEDTNVAGLIMALEQSIVMGTALVVLFARGLAESEREQLRDERYALEEEAAA
jgi:putative membrane protein